MITADHDKDSFLAGFESCRLLFMADITEARRNRRNIINVMQDRGRFHFRTMTLKAENLHCAMKKSDALVMGAAILFAIYATFFIWVAQ